MKTARLHELGHITSISAALHAFSCQSQNSLLKRYIRRLIPARTLAQRESANFLEESLYQAHRGLNLLDLLHRFRDDVPVCIPLVAL
jgi:hypothetical protein